LTFKTQKGIQSGSRGVIIEFWVKRSNSREFCSGKMRDGNHKLDNPNDRPQLHKDIFEPVTQCLDLIHRLRIANQIFEDRNDGRGLPTGYQGRVLL
jgi:hypothetical protein